MLCMTSKRPVSSFIFSKRRLALRGSADIRHESPISSPVAVRIAPKKDVFSAVKEAAVTSSCDVGERTWMLQVASLAFSMSVSVVGAVHESLPKMLGIDVSPFGRYAALKESVLPVVDGLATVLIPFSHRWSAYWLLRVIRNVDALKVVVVVMVISRMCRCLLPLKAILYFLSSY